MSDIWLQFEVYYNEESKYVAVSLSEYKDRKKATSPFDTESFISSLPDKVGREIFKVRPWHLARPVLLADKVAKIKKKLLVAYWKDRQVKNQLKEACSEWSREKILIQDGQLARIIEELNKR